MQFKFYGKGNNQLRHYSNTKQTLETKQTLDFFQTCSMKLRSVENALNLKT